MKDPVTTLAQAQHGVLTRTQLRESGLSRATIRHLIDRRRLVALTTQVLRLRGAPASRGRTAMAAVLDAGPSAVLSHCSGAAWWRVNGCQLAPVHVTRASRSRRGSTLSRVHIVRELPESWTTVLDGVPVARPELVALQLFASNPYERAERWVERLWSLRLLDGRSLIRMIDQLGRSGRNGTAGVRRYIGDRGADYVPPASNVESRTLQILKSAGITMRCQVDLGADQWTGRVDFFHDDGVVLEVQSEMYHRALVDRRADAERLARLRSDGLIVLEATDTEVFHRPGAVINRVKRALSR